MVWVLAVSAALSWCHTDEKDCDKIVKAAWEPALPWCVEISNDVKNKTNDTLMKWNYNQSWVNKRR